MPSALRVRTDAAATSLAIAALDAEDEFVICRSVSGEALRASVGTSDLLDIWLLGTGAAGTGAIKHMMRLAFQGVADTAHFQSRYYQGATARNIHQLDQDVSGLKAYADYAFRAGRTATEELLQVAEFDPRTKTYSWVVNVTPEAVDTIQSVTGTKVYLLPQPGDKTINVATTTLASEGSVDFGFFWIKVGAAANALTAAANPQDLFAEPADADCLLKLGFRDGSGATITDESPNGHDFTLPGTEFTDYQWIGGNPSFDFEDGLQPAGSYEGAHGDTSDNQDCIYTSNRVTFLSATHNTETNKDPEFGFGGPAGAGPFNVKTDVYRQRNHAHTMPAAWWSVTNDNGGFTDMFRNDIAADGSDLGVQTWLLGAQWLNYGSTVAIRAQTQINGGTIDEDTPATDQLVVDPADGPFLYEYWGKGNGDVEIRISDPTTLAWHTIYDSEVYARDWSALPAELAHRNQLKNRTGGNSGLTGSDEAWADDMGSTLIGHWATAAPVPLSADTPIAAERLLAASTDWDLFAEHLLEAASTPLTADAVLGGEHLLALSAALSSSSEHLRALATLRELGAEHLLQLLATIDVPGEHQALFAPLVVDTSVPGEHLCLVVADVSIAGEHQTIGALTGGYVAIKNILVNGRPLVAGEHGQLWVGSDNTVELHDVTDGLTGEAILNGTGTAVLLDKNGTEVDGQAWPVSLQLIPDGTKARYYFSVTRDAELQRRRVYVAQITFLGGPGRYWEIPFDAVVSAGAL